MLLLTSAGRDVIPIIFSISPPVSPPAPKKRKEKKKKVGSGDPNTNTKRICLYRPHTKEAVQDSH